MLSGLAVENNIAGLYCILTCGLAGIGVLEMWKLSGRMYVCMCSCFCSFSEIVTWRSCPQPRE